MDVWNVFVGECKGGYVAGWWVGGFMGGLDAGW